MKVKRRGTNSLLDLVGSVAASNNLASETVANLLSQALKTAFLREYPDNFVDVIIDLKDSRVEI